MEGINHAKVTGWLEARIPALAPPLGFSLIAGGHSNLTYQVTDQTGTAWVLRRPPLGAVLESAHDMGREYRIIHALRNSRVPVPPAIGLCEDKSINGAPFYVMKHVAGHVLHDLESVEAATGLDRQSVGRDAVEVLAHLHLVDPDAVGLGALGRKEAYLARQLKRWSRQWEASRTHEVPEMEASARLLADTMPDQVGASIVHGDYRLGNMIVRDREVAAVLDWELCTLGDPLADVGYLLNTWADPSELNPAAITQSPTCAGGFASREEVADWYSAATGRSLEHIRYYRAFAHWRLAAIGQGVYKRYLVGAMGQNREVDLEAHKASVSQRAQAALELLS